MNGYLYFMIHNKEIIYIGQTVDIVRRIREHCIYASFDDVRIIECPIGKLREYERRLIQYFKPKCNCSHNPDRDWKDRLNFMPYRKRVKKRKTILDYPQLSKLVVGVKEKQAA